MAIFNLESHEVAYLLDKDRVLGRLIRAIGECSLNTVENYFEFLVRCIVGQQLSGNAAEIINARINDLLENHITPEHVSVIDESMLRECGASSRKIEFIKGLSNEIITGNVNLENLLHYSETEIRSELTKIKGIGPWTSDMLIIFCLHRMDVFSLNDSGLRTAVNILYGNGISLPNEEIKRISDNWKPYRTIASLYLWLGIDTGLLSSRGLNLKEI